MLIGSFLSQFIAKLYYIFILFLKLVKTSVHKQLDKLSKMSCCILSEKARVFNNLLTVV